MMSAQALWTFVSGPAALAVLLATALLAWPAGVRIARRQGCPRLAAALFVVAVGVIVALTLTPSRTMSGVIEVPPPHYLTQIDDLLFVWSTLTAAPSDAEQLANIALYVPVGLLGGFVWRGVARATLFGLALTVAIETCQYGIIGRAGSLTDIRNNALGALIGALLAGAVRAVAGRWPVSAGAPTRRHRRAP